MVSIFELLQQEKDKVKELNELRTDLVEAERLRELDEGNAWKMDFKSIGATSDKLRAAAVKRKLNQFPNTFAQKKAEFANIEEELRALRHLIRTMNTFEIKEIELDDKKDQDKNTSDKVSG